MADIAAPPVRPPRTLATVGDIMRPPATTAEPNDHVAAAAYLMKHAGATALVILDPRTGRPVGIITETDITHAVADGKNLNDVRIHELMTARPVVIDKTTTIPDAARTMTAGRFRHMPVVSDDSLVGMVDITDVCRALLGSDAPPLAATGTAQPR
jgi:CBS domain-containing protein